MIRGKGKLTHDIHARKLGPDLSEDSNMCPIDHIRFKQLQIGHISVVALKFAHVLDILQFAHDKRRIGVAVAVDECENGVAIFPAVLAGQPTW